MLSLTHTHTDITHASIACTPHTNNTCTHLNTNKTINITFSSMYAVGGSVELGGGGGGAKCVQRTAQTSSVCVECVSPAMFTPLTKCECSNNHQPVYESVRGATFSAAWHYYTSNQSLSVRAHECQRRRILGMCVCVCDVASPGDRVSARVNINITQTASVCGATTEHNRTDNTNTHTQTRALTQHINACACV